MAKQKKPIHRVQMTEGKRNIIHQLLEEYDIQTAEDIRDALKDLLGGTIKEMMEAEMDEHLGYPQIDSKHLRLSLIHISEPTRLALSTNVQIFHRPQRNSYSIVYVPSIISINFRKNLRC